MVFLSLLRQWNKRLELHNPLQNHSPKRFSTFILSFCYWLNSKTLNSKFLEELIWKHFKVVYFIIAGQCKKRGVCCKQVTLYRNNAQVNSIHQYEQLISDQPNLSCFKPISNKKNKTLAFTCEQLTKNKLCRSYHNRPMLCRLYPYSYFVQTDRILEGCGYSIKKRAAVWLFPSQQLLIRINTILNRI